MTKIALPKSGDVGHLLALGALVAALFKAYNDGIDGAEGMGEGLEVDNAQMLFFDKASGTDFVLSIRPATEGEREEHERGRAEQAEADEAEGEA